MFTLLRDEFLSADLDVFMFDFFGSGESDGLFRDKTWSGMRRNLGDALDLVEAKLGTSGTGQISLVSRSVGASIAGFFVKDPRVACSVLSSPVLRLVNQFQPYWSPLVDGFVEMPDQVERSGQIKGAWVLNQQFFDELESTENELVSAVKGAQRVLVTHGLSDPKVVTANSTELMGLLAEPKRYVGVESGDHYYTGHENEAVDVAVDWVLRYTSAYQET